MPTAEPALRKRAPGREASAPCGVAPAASADPPGLSRTEFPALPSSICRCLR